MLDLRLLRTDPDQLRSGIAKRGEAADIDRLVALDAEHRRALSESEKLKAERNARSKEVAKLLAAEEQGDAESLKSEMRQVSARIKELDERSEALKENLDGLWLEIPNLPHETVPAGDAEQNEIVRMWGTIREFDFAPQPHWDLGDELGILDLARAA
ncbi:MAG: serine--tRNA ligase, partial [Gemmatimonadetes bacterium]|nr:serine--tRNA ligase [Gemmatimonadota bacterium]